MNKKLVAVAIAGLLAAPLAQAQTANVTLYGRINIDMEFVNGRLANNTNPNVYRVASNSSRFGLRGTESLGGGLNAIFQIENGSIRPTTGDGGNLAGRDSFVGLSGGWGTFKMGRFLAPYDDIHGIFGNDNTAATSILSTAACVGAGLRRPADHRRLRRSPAAIDPLRDAVVFGLRFHGAVLDHGRHEQPDQRELPVEQHQRPVATACSTATDPPSSVQRTSITTTSAARPRMPLSDWAFSVAASGSSRASTSPACTKRWNTKSPTALSGVRNKLKRNSFWARGHDDQRRRERPGLPVLGQGVGRHGQRAQHAASGRHAELPSSTSQYLARRRPRQGRQHRCHQWEVSYSYDLSRRTRVYAGYVKINNDSNASYNFNINAYPGSAVAPGSPVGMKPGGFVMGMYHNF